MRCTSRRGANQLAFWRAEAQRNHFPTNVSTVSPSPATPGQLIGQVRRFGSFGVLYEVLEPINETHFLVRVLDTGEELAYPLTKIVIDPRD